MFCLYEHLALQIQVHSNSCSLIPLYSLVLLPAEVMITSHIGSWYLLAKGLSEFIFELVSKEITIGVFFLL